MGLYFGLRSSKLSVQKVLLYPFQWKPRPSGVTLESSGLENIPQVPGEMEPKLVKITMSRKVVSATLSSLKVKWGNISAKKLESECLKSFALSHFSANQGTSEVTLESPGHEGISPKSREIEPKFDQIHDARNVVSATVSSPKVKWLTIFRPTS